MLLDDPFSALDAGTGAKVFESLIHGPDALFANSAVILVTHAAHFIRQVDGMVLVVEGRNAFSGPWSDLETFETQDPKVALAIDSIRSHVSENKEGIDSSEQKALGQRRPGEPQADRQNEVKMLMTKEEREHGTSLTSAVASRILTTLNISGLSSLRTWLLWFDYAGGVFFIVLMLVFLAIDRSVYVAVEYFLARYEPIKCLLSFRVPQLFSFQGGRKVLSVQSISQE